MSLRKKILLIAISAVYVLLMIGKWFWSVPGVVEVCGEDIAYNTCLWFPLVLSMFWVGVWALGTKKRLYTALRFSMLTVLTGIDLYWFLISPAALNQVPISLAVSFSYTYPLFYLHIAALMGMWAVTVWGQFDVKSANVQPVAN